jgi:tripartite-type tricarboxylate transporter receptor subunit TctC
VELATIQLGEAMPQIQAGKVAPLLVFSEERNTFLPDVPTAKESGYDVPVAQYRAVAAPKGTSQVAKDKLLAAFKETFKSEAYQEFNKKNMLTPKEISGEEVVTQWKEYAAKYKSLVEKYDISLSGTK